MIAIRWFVSVVLAVLITLLLFIIMQSLIATGAVMQQQAIVFDVVDSTMPEIEMELVTQIMKPEPLPEVDIAPPAATEREFAFETGIGINIERTAPIDIDDLVIPNGGIGLSDTEMLPLVNVLPVYPSRAASQGIQGWVQVSLTVTETGNVRDVIVVDAEPAGVFDRAAVTAAEKFRFQPRVVNGAGVVVPNVPYVFRFQLE